jgi:hypothetical protein
LIEHHLLNAGILLDRGRKVCLVTSEESHWHQSLISAIFKLTGRYPCLIQTENRRKDLNNLVHIRVVDMEELIGKDNTKI